MKLTRYTETTNELAHQLLSNLAWYWVTLSPFGEIVTNHQYKLVLSRGFWQWAKNVNGDSFNHVLL